MSSPNHSICMTVEISNNNNNKVKHEHHFFLILIVVHDLFLTVKALILINLPPEKTNLFLTGIQLRKKNSK